MKVPDTCPENSNKEAPLRKSMTELVEDFKQMYDKLMSLKYSFRVLLALLLFAVAYSWWRGGTGYILTIVMPLSIGPLLFFPALRWAVNSYRKGNLLHLGLAGLCLVLAVLVGSIGAIVAAYLVALNDATMACYIGNNGHFSYEECRTIVLRITDRKGFWFPAYN